MSRSYPPTLPSSAGLTLWPHSRGYLDLHANEAGRSALPCTCTGACLRKDCHGRCGCEACALAWMIREDERALWDAQGNLVAPEHIDGPWRRIRDPNQLRIRFQHQAADSSPSKENTHG